MMGQQQETVAGSALRRIIMVLAVATVMAAMMAVSAGSAFAASFGNDKANCVGRNATLFNEVGKERGEHGFGGKIVKGEAPGGGVGNAASTNCN
jgi:hypothetical protein